MNKRLVIGGLVLAVVAAVVALVVLRERRQPSARSADHDATTGLIDEFRVVERASLRRYNDALAEQRANRIDEIGLADILEREVLPPWRALRERVTAAPVPAARNELYETLKRYLEARQLSWEAYVAGLRAGSDVAARPHYDVHHQKSADADQEARELGRLFRELHL
jgi:hypothetical protein